jgi:hypothetical protein
VVGQRKGPSGENSPPVHGIKKCLDIIEELSWQPLMERWGNNKAIFMHKVTKGEYLENISSLFVVKNNDNYNLRNNNIDYKLEKPKTNFLKKASAIQV